MIDEENSTGLQSETVCAADEEFLNELKEVLNYDPETGLMTWKVSNSNRVRVGSAAGTVNNKGRLHIKFKNKKYFGHRLAWLLTYGKWPEKLIDHIDGNPLNNRIANLRNVSNSTNLENQRKPQSGNQSGFLGVSWYKPLQKFRAKISVNGRGKHLGYFLTAEEAYAVYLATKRELHEGCTV